MSLSSTGGRRCSLTVAMIVRDAETMLPSTLNCVREVADELVIGDTGSIDGTKAIAESLADTVVDVPWTDDFSAARNAVLADCRGDWILWLDAGETISDADLTALRQFIDNQADPTLAYMSLVRLPNKTGDVSGEQVGRIRLVPRKPELKFEGRIREQVRPSIERAGMDVASLPITILRSQSDHLASVKRAKAERDVRIAELAIGEQGIRSDLLLAKAEALMTLGDNAAARKLYQQARSASVAKSSQMLEAYYGELTTYDGEPDAEQKQIALCVEAVEQYPLDAQLLCAMGSYLQGQGRVDLATRAYETCVQYGQVNPEIWHLADISEVVTICLSFCLQQQQQDDRARELLEDAITRRPEMLKLHRHLIDLHIKHGRRKEALELVNAFPSEACPREAFRSAVRGACLAVEKNWIAAKAYLQTAYHGGCREATCFRWLIVTHLALEDARSAEKTLDAWREWEPNQVEVERFQAAIAAQSNGQAAAEPTAESPAPRPSFSQAPSQITTTSGQTMRIDPPAKPTEEAAPSRERRGAKTPSSFTIDPTWRGE